MGANSEERMARIHELEMLRQNALHKTESITRDEEARLLELRLLTMRDENATLRDKLAQNDFKFSSVLKETDQIRIDLDDSKQVIRTQETRLKKQDLDMSSLKAEIESLNGSMQDSGKALQEKFALTRELNRIKPELDHLQSQLAAYQSTIVEKNDLRRQLDSLEVELENEKRSRLRLQSKDNDAATEELKDQVERAEKKLAAEKKERERSQKQHEKELAAANAENERLEERVSSLKEKSKTLQAELKEAKEQLENARSELSSNKRRPVSRGGGEDKPKKAITLTTDVGKKRRAPQMNFEEITIQTPGNDIVARERPTKKRGADKATVGTKSEFSITPFLNRTKSLTDDSAHEESSNNASAVAAHSEPMSDGPADIEPPSEPEHEDPAPKSKVSFNSTVSFQSPVAAKTRGRPTKVTPLGESTPAKTNRVMKSRGTPKVKSITAKRVDSVEERPTQVEQENVSVAVPEKTAPVLQPKAPEGEVKRRKRKLLGAAKATLFDDDDGEAVAQPKPLPAAGKRTRTVLGGPKKNAFVGSSFSPLKRDRRGVNASFLA